MTPQFPFGGRARLFAAVSPILSATLLLTSAAQAEVIVDTIGGGPVQGNLKPYGLKNGNTLLYSQFNGPFGIALDSLGNLYVADKTNNVIRKVTQVGDTANSQTTNRISTTTARSSR